MLYRGRENFARRKFCGENVAIKNGGEILSVEIRGTTGPSRALEIRAVTRSDRASDSDRDGNSIRSSGSGSGSVLQIWKLCLLHICCVLVQEFGRMALQFWGFPGGENFPWRDCTRAKSSHPL